MAPALPTETVAISSLRPHPDNYRLHPDGQLEHVETSLTEHGQYRQVVVAKDGTVLAGHGVVMAAQRLGWDELNVARVPYGPNDPEAIKILVGDNEISRMAEVDDRALTDHLRQLAELEELRGTGFDDRSYAELVYVTSPRGQVADLAEAAVLAGVDIGEDSKLPQFVVSFLDEETRAAFAAEHKIVLTHEQGRVWIGRWPE